MSWPRHDVIPRPGPLEAGAIADGLLSDAGALFVRVPFLIPWPFFCGVASIILSRPLTYGLVRVLGGLDVV